jgi:hypothetical protein
MPNEAASSRCPTDETLAAFSDGGLTESEGEMLVAHITSCIRCQFTVVALERSRLSVANSNGKKESSKDVAEASPDATTSDVKPKNGCP